MKNVAALLLVVSACMSTVAFAAPRTPNKSNVVEQARYAAAISNKWSREIRARYGISSSEWTERMLDTFSASDLANLRRAAAADTFDGMSGALFGGSSAANIVDVRPLQLGSTENSLTFTPLPPCRIVDTRLVGGPIAASGNRSFVGWTSTDFVAQGGASTNCGIPANASALKANIVAVDTANPAGYLTVYPSNTPQPNAASVNFNGSDVANEIALKLCRPGCPTQFSVFSTASTHFVVDVYGYYMEPIATPLDCVTATATGGLLNLGSITNVTASCPTGYTATGGGCGGPLGLTVASTRAAVDASGRPIGWTCGLTTSLVGGLLGYSADATCCRVPGR